MDSLLGCMEEQIRIVDECHISTSTLWMAAFDSRISGDLVEDIGGELNI